MSKKVGSEGRIYVTRHLWVPQKPLEKFNLWISDRIKAKLPPLPVSGDSAVAMFPEIAALQAAHDDIKAELTSLLDGNHTIPLLHEIHPRDAPISSAKWRNYILSLWGNHIDVNRARCPATVAAISRIPGMHTAVFSILDARSAIPAHRGWAAGVVRCHYPLIVPDERDACFLAIEGNRHSWREGEPLLFDDTREHLVENDTDQRRVVLIVDFEPRLPLAERIFCSLRYRFIRRSIEIREMVGKAEVGGQPAPDGRNTA